MLDHQQHDSISNEIDSKLRDQAIKLLARREHSRLELMQKLLLRGYAEHAVESVFDWLIERNLLSDKRFCEMYIRTYQHRYGAVRVRQKLKEKGVSSSLIGEMLSTDEQSQLHQAMLMREKKFGPSLPLQKSQWLKEANFLARKGFSSDVVAKALKPSKQ